MDEQPEAPSSSNSHPIAARALPCPGCGAPAAPDQRFCGQCGTALRRVCAACRAQNPPDHRFCGQCGAPLDKPAVAPARLEPEERVPPPREERRWATVLFADLSGFIAAAERMDPEDV